VQELRIPSGVPEALERLKAAGFVLICVTNQPDVARGLQRREVVEAMNAALRATLPVEDFLVCYHDDRDGCLCRKPKPGLLLHAAAAHGIDLRASYMVGDRWRDVDAGRRAGCVTIQLGSGYAEQGPASPPDHTARSLTEAASWILNRARTS
jgi:D-glycero-D-manno-heptose 1,7-bisphosphate phosphatase